jgi:hypothetical protein
MLEYHNSGCWNRRFESRREGIDFRLLVLLCRKRIMRRADLSPPGSVFLILWLSSNLDSEAALARYGLYSPKSIYMCLTILVTAYVAFLPYIPLWSPNRNIREFGQDIKKIKSILCFMWRSVRVVGSVWTLKPFKDTNPYTIKTINPVRLTWICSCFNEWLFCPTPREEQYTSSVKQR